MFNSGVQMKLLILTFQVFLLFTFVLSDYWQNRQVFIEQEDRSSLGCSLILNEKEKRVNSILTNFKFKEVDYGFLHPNEFPPAQHFFLARENISKAETFKIIQKLPKGSSLHGHDVSLASFDVVYNFTYRPNLYGCVDNEKLKLKFSSDVPLDCNWKLVSELRKEIPNFDNYLKSQLSMVVENPHSAYPDVNAAWKKFQSCFDPIFSLLSYRPVFREYFWEVLEELYEDNVKYIELRTIFPELYDLNGTTYDSEENVKIYLEVLDSFKKEHPDFIGAKVIYSQMRNIDPVQLEQFIEDFLILREKFPDFIIGFDLVGQEDPGRPLKDYIPELLKIANKTKFFFHAGETDWNGSPTDYNLIDAVLLNTTRIGHGYAIVKHPDVLKMVMERQIAIEVNPVSNQVLKLVDDLRNHPAADLIAISCPIVVCSDAPGVWGSKGLSYDWYLTFLGMTRRNSDLRFLKQLAINSITYSAMSQEAKDAAMVQWNSDWERFLDDIIKAYSDVIY